MSRDCPINLDDDVTLSLSLGVDVAHAIEVFEDGSDEQDFGNVHELRSVNRQLVRVRARNAERNRNKRDEVAVKRSKTMRSYVDVSAEPEDLDRLLRGSSANRTTSRGVKDRAREVAEKLATVRRHKEAQHEAEADKESAERGETGARPTQEQLGVRLLKKAGYTGGGIGKDGQGITKPIKAVNNVGVRGLGFYTHSKRR
jgi:hypothetical protein